MVGSEQGIRLRDHTNRPMEYSFFMVMLWGIFFCTLARIYRWLLLRFPPRLNATAKGNKDTKDTEAFACYGAQCCVAMTLHPFLGTAALYNTIAYMRAAPSAALSAYFTDNIDPHHAQLDFNILFMGEIFTGNMVYQLTHWILRWESGLDLLIHHIGFLVAGCLVLYITVYGQIASAAIAMEVSSPWLSLHCFARSLEDARWSSISNIASAVFGVTFIVTRIFFYGYVVFDFQYNYWFRPEIFPSWTPASLTLSVVVCFTLAWILQLFWAQFVIKKALGIFKIVVKQSKAKA